jgi:hypothetical protein
MSAHGSQTTLPDLVREMVNEYVKKASWTLTEEHRDRISARVLERQVISPTAFDAYRLDSVRCEDSENYWSTKLARVFVDKDNSPGPLSTACMFVAMGWAAAVYFQPGFVPFGSVILAHWYYPAILLAAGMIPFVTIGPVLNRPYEARRSSCAASRGKIRDIVFGEVRKLLADPSIALDRRGVGDAILHRPYAFLLCPYPADTDDERSFYTGTLFSTVREAAAQAGMHCYLANEVLSPGLVLDTIMVGIANADLVLADVTEPNLNVYYEIGLAHGLQKGVLLLTAGAPKDLPFDLAVNRALQYSRARADLLREDLLRGFAQWRRQSPGVGRGTDPGNP